MAQNEIRFEYAGALAENLKSQEHGLTNEQWSDLQAETTQIVKRLNANRSETPYRDLPHKEELAQCAAVLESVKNKEGRFDDVVVLGIGGSALGLTALKTALRPPFWNLLPPDQRHGRPRLWVMDNIDPVEFTAMLKQIDLKRTLVNVISKGGDTTETMVQFLIMLDLLKNRIGEGEDWKQQLVVITKPEDSPLLRFTQAENLEWFKIDPNIGGRFSVLSPVGLFGAAMIGINIEKLLEGAAAMDERCSSTDFETNPAAQGAAVQIGLYRKGKIMSVMMPYSAALADVADWYRQLWAESLGKTRADGTPVGPTPIRALGVTDQHSQVQLYREGPADKVITILSVEDFAVAVPIPDEPPGMAGVDYLTGRSMAEVLHAEEQATMWALTRLSQRPTVRVVLPDVTPRSVGELLYLLMVETSIAGEMLGLGKLTYLQPGVQESKRATKDLLGESRSDGGSGPASPSDN